MKKFFLLWIPIGLFIGAICLMWGYSTLIPLIIINFCLIAILFFFFIVGIVSSSIKNNVKKNGFETTAKIVYFKDMYAKRMESFDTQNPLTHAAYTVFLEYVDENGVTQKSYDPHIIMGKEAQELKKLKEVKIRCKGKNVCIIK